MIHHTVVRGVSTFDKAVTHHSNRKIVVNDLVRYGVSDLLGVVRYHLDAPTIQWNHRADFNLLQDFSQI